MSSNRTFRIVKHGRLVRVKQRGTDSFRRQEVYEPLPADRIVGVDTESLLVEGRLRTVLVPMHFSTGQELVEGPTDGVLERVLDSVCGRYSVKDEGESRTAQRPIRDGFRRDGRRETVEPVLLVFFNLPYDIGRLASDQRMLLRALASGAEAYRVRVGKYEVEVSRMVLGHGASFEWHVRHDGRVTRVLGIDVHGYWKSSLAAAARAVGVTEKLDLDASIYETPREALSDEQWEEFRTYSLGDVQTTVELYQATVHLLRTIDARVVRRTGVVPPSAPGAAARITFAKAFDCHPEMETWRRYPAWADQMGCDAYAGARAFCARPGVHRGVRVYDLKSAYPHALTLLPDPVDVDMQLLPKQQWTERLRERLRGKFGVLYASGEGLDPVYPMLRTRDLDHGGRLQYVYGRFSDLPVTIPEVIIGLEAGNLRIDGISKGVVMEGRAEDSFLRRAMLDFFAIKDDPNNAKALQDFGKLMAVSTYGKLVEVQCDRPWLDSGVMCPRFAEEEDALDALSRLYAETPEDEFDDAADALIARCRRHKFRCQDQSCRGCGPEPTIEGPWLPIRVQMSAMRKYESGQYFMPVYAAQITGFTSASLGLMARVSRAAQGDTDSVHPVGDFEDEPYYRTMTRAGYPAPKRGLGHWACETPEPSEESVCARPKLYSHFFRTPLKYEEDPKTKERRPVHHKQAKHGFAKYPHGREQLHHAIREVALGRSVKYSTKPSPRKLREALVAGLEVGEFISREIEVTSRLDPNVEVVDGWTNWKRMG